MYMVLKYVSCEVLSSSSAPPRFLSLFPQKKDYEIFVSVVAILACAQLLVFKAFAEKN